MNIGTVVEGPTDRLVLQAILDRLLPGEHRYLPLQPPATFGERGTGWKGVRRWCRETWQRSGSDLDRLLAGDTGPALDLLVIHVDADIADEPDQDTEHWTFAALFPDDDLCAREDYECAKSGREDQPGFRLTLKAYGKPLQRRDGRVKKTVRAYRRLALQVARAWDGVCLICSQARRFTVDVQHAANTPEPQI